MDNNIKHELERINEVSRQLLSRIHGIQVNSNIVAEAKESEVQEEQSNIVELMQNRQELIISFFNQYSAEEISSQKLQLNTLYQLDQELTTKSNICKQSIMEQVIKLKKSKKVKKSYQKY